MRPAVLFGMLRRMAYTHRKYHLSSSANRNSHGIEYHRTFASTQLHTEFDKTMYGDDTRYDDHATFLATLLATFIATLSPLSSPLWAESVVTLATSTGINFTRADDLSYQAHGSKRRVAKI